MFKRKGLANKQNNKQENSKSDCLDVVNIQIGNKNQPIQWLSEDEIDNIIDEAWNSIPANLRQQLLNITIWIDDYPEEKYNASLSPNSILLGLYVGIPLTKRSNYGLVNSPDVVHIYKNNIFLVSANKAEAQERIRKTVLHELGHYFGLDDNRLYSLGY